MTGCCSGSGTMSEAELHVLRALAIRAAWVPDRVRAHFGRDHVRSNAPAG